MLRWMGDKSPIVARRLLAVALLLAFAGCRPLGSNPWSLWRANRTAQSEAEAAKDKRPADQAEANEPRAAVPDALASDSWIRAVADREGHPPRWQWCNPTVDRYSQAESPAADQLAGWLDDPRPLVAANAAILLARSGDARGREVLLRTEQATPLKLPLRRAALEALASLDLPTTGADLARMLEAQGDPQRTPAIYSPELHADLLNWLAARQGVKDQAPFVAALGSRSPEVRLAAVAAWQRPGAGELPVEAADLRTDPSPLVRCAALKSIAATRPTEGFESIRSALSDHDLDVRLTAIAALAQLDDPRSAVALETVRANEGEVLRAAAVAALLRMNADRALSLGLGDASWRVRAEVARELAGRPTRAGREAAAKLLGDASLEVQRQAMTALESWPLDQALPLLLDACDHSAYATRQRAVEQLRRRWPAAAGFSADAPAERRKEMLVALRRQALEEFGQVDRQALRNATAAAETLPPEVYERVTQACVRLAGTISSVDERRALDDLRRLGPELLTACDRYVATDDAVIPAVIYREVLSDRGDDFAALHELDHAQVEHRRAAAEKLDELATRDGLRPAVATRMVELGRSERDPQVCRSLVHAAQRDGGMFGEQLASAYLSHPAPDVRHAACELLALHGRPAHVAALAAVLTDDNVWVVKGAVRALGNPAMKTDPALLQPLLATQDRTLRLEVATSLARLGAPAGGAALDRLASENEADLRRQAARAMGETRDRQFTATLVRLLDDVLSVRAAALEALPLVVGRDVAAENNTGRATSDLAHRVAAWKTWWQQEQAQSR